MGPDAPLTRTREIMAYAMSLYQLATLHAKTLGNSQVSARLKRGRLLP